MRLDQLLPGVPSGAAGVEITALCYDNLRLAPGTLFWNAQPLPEAQFLQTMRDEQRLIYQFEEPSRVYGLLT